MTETSDSWCRRARGLVERERSKVDRCADVLLDFICEIRASLPGGAAIADIILSGIIDDLSPHIADRGGAGASYSQTLANCGRWLFAAEQIMKEDYGRSIAA